MLWYLLASLFFSFAALAVPQPGLSNGIDNTSLGLAARSSNSTSTSKRNMAYWLVYSGTPTPSADQVKNVTHMLLAFVDMSSFTAFESSTNGGAFTPEFVKTLRNLNPNMKIMASAGGWGSDTPFRPASADAASRSAFATKVATFIEAFDLDGIDLDWEYPVGNGANYKLPSSDPDARPTDYEDAPNFASLLAAIRSAIGSGKIISVPLPARTVDMIGYSNSTIVGQMDQSVDFWNLMSYDYVNRRDNFTNHHSGGMVIGNTIDAYSKVGIDKQKMNIGYAMYAKYFVLPSSSTCSAANPIGCPMGPYEDSTGQDLGGDGSYEWAVALNPVNSTVDAWTSNVPWESASNSTAQASAWYDETNHVFWTWASTEDTAASCKTYASQTGGVFYWSYITDTNGSSGGPHVDAINECIAAAA